MVPVTDESVGALGSALVDRLCILTALAPDDGPDRLTPTPVLPVASSPLVESLVFEDNSILHWSVFLAANRPAREPGDYGRPPDGVIPGFVRRIADETILGPMSSGRKLVMVLPSKTFDMEKEATLGAAFGNLWWKRN